MVTKKNSLYDHPIAYFLQHLVAPKYQIISIVLVVTILAGLFTYVFSTFNVFEEKPELRPISPQELRTLASSTTQVQVGLHINNFPKFDVRSNSFVFDGIIWFLFDQSAISLATVEKFSFARGTILQKSPPNTKIIGGNFFAQYNIRVEFKADLNQKYFPFDDHRLYIEMINKYVTPEELIFSSSLSSFLISDDILIISWKPIDQEVETGFDESVLDKFEPDINVYHPKILFSIDFKRIGIQDIFLIFLPLCLMVFICLFSLGFDPPKESGWILTLSLSSITGLMAYRFVLQSLTPQVGYFILSDCFFLLFLALCFICFCTGLIVIRKGKLTPPLAILRGLVYLFSNIALIGFSFYFLFYWPYH